MLTGLWQVADMERSGKPLDIEPAAAALAEYAAAGFDTFDMADHYGSAELITGRFLANLRAGAVSLPPGITPRVCTKWCPAPGPMTSDVVRKGIQARLDRLGVSRLDLLQFHWWTFEHPQYLDAMKELAKLVEEGVIGHLGVTNFDTMHLRILVKHGIPITSNQVCISLLDRRAAEELSEFCLAHGVKLLAYGTLGGGFLSDRWVGRPEPTAADIPDWSKMKYKRFIDAVGGWDAVQHVLGAAKAIAQKHGVSVANVATRWVLELPAVAGIIVGVRLGERVHRADNLKLFSFALDAEDRGRLNAALAHTTRIPGDCGDEYRQPPFLTASGDLSHHLARLPPVYQAAPVPGRPDRTRIDSKSIWEPLAGFSRAMRVGNRILVCGTTATHGASEIVCPGDVAAQTTYALDKIKAAIMALGGTLQDVVRTRVYLRDIKHWEEASRVHGRYFGEIRPANTLIGSIGLVGGYEVEIEAEAELPA